MVIRKATFSTLRGAIEITGRRIPLIELKATGSEPSRGRGQGVSYSLGGQRRRRGTAFITTLKSGHRGVFKRLGPSVSKSTGAWSKNLPIVELRGPSIPRVAAKRSILNALKTVGQVTLARNLNAEIRFVLSGRAVHAGGD
jgi:hypothetical protein